jgi:hypothetical protein
MTSHARFIEFLKSQHPAIWASLQNAAVDGLVQIDEDADTVTATNRLLLTYPGLHEAIHGLINGWAENQLDASDTFSTLLATARGATADE